MVWGIINKFLSLKPHKFLCISLNIDIISMCMCSHSVILLEYQRILILCSRFTLLVTGSV